MASNITTLPTEILHEILGHLDLDRSDLCDASRVCKTFYHVAKEYIPRDRDIALHNNRPGQLTTFLRRLLAEPSFGRNFTELSVVWGYTERNNVPASKTPAEGGENEKGEEFKWTAVELESLNVLAKKYSFHPRWIKSIQELQDPASLLIPILCLLPALEGLDMGTPVADIDLEGVYSDCLDAHLEEFIYRLIMDDKKHIVEPEELQKRFPESLITLKRFSRGHMDEQDGFDIDKIFPIFLLPNIQKTELNTLGGDFSLLSRFSQSTYLCKVKHLGLFNLECEATELARFFGFCEALEFVKVRFEWVNMGILEDWEDVEETFDLTVVQTALMRHKETLRDASVEVERDYWWFKRMKGKWRCGRKPSWWGGEDWGSTDDEEEEEEEG
ncbi:uncharacterized protein DFL_003834 [Arthrobotrys flagrans]|uniref:F-box domain-containing protein n=1 Tax=Arthrobotrys flagrans TaxID=97331 RepID=A0A437A2Z5_ARTFL|nr:hypothetical protein DFL_003834 [Arthrobotrys flagrans]